MYLMISEFVNSGGSHFWGGLATLWIFSAAVSAMCPPVASSTQQYQWLYRFAHLLAANLDRAGLFSATSFLPLIKANK